MFEALGALIYRHRVLTLLLSGAFLVGSLVMLLRGGDLTSGKIRGLEADQADQLAEEVIGHPMDTTFVAVFRSADLDARDAAFTAAMEKALGAVRDDPHVLAVVTPSRAPPPLARGMVNGPARSAFALITLKDDVKQALQAYPGVRAKLRSDRLTITCTGHVPFLHDLGRALERDLVRAEVVSLPLALLVLLVVFRTAVAAILPVGVGALAVAGGIAIIFGLSHYIDIAQYTINVCSLIGLGVAIDYSLFTVSRYREELAAGHAYPQALARAMGGAGRVVAFSGLAVGTGLTGLLFFEGSYLLAMGIGGSIVVGLAVVFDLTFLPALLAILGPRIHAGKLPLGRLGPREGMWRRTAEWVMRRPLQTLLPTLAILLLMGVPFLRLRMTASDVRVLGRDIEARSGYEMLRADFPERAQTPILVAVRFPSSPALTEERVGALFDLSRRISGIAHVTKVESIVDGEPSLGRHDYQRFLLDPPAPLAEQVEMAKRMTVGGNVVLLQAFTDRTRETAEARNIIRGIRDRRQVGDGALVVGGPTASDMDSTDYILKRTPRAVGFVVGVTVVVLFLLLGSVILPLKAIAMNFVSIAGSFGALVWIFQEGHLFVDEPGPLEPSLPILLFCVLFGLSMDYEVLMLSRIKEAYEKTGDNSRAVGEGLEKTAGLITSAAAIMVVVFSAFSLATVALIKAVGIGMALAVTLDATLVRILVVPATMRLFGDLNWWAPSPLTALRRLLRLDTSHP